LAYKHNLRILEFGIFYPLVIFLMTIMGSYATLKLFDTGLDIYRSLRPLFLSILPTEQSSIQDLCHLRETLSRDLTELINELGPKMYPDFESSRIVKESRENRDSRTPSPSRPSSRLISWIDEKLFNWESAEESDYDDVISFIDKLSRGRRKRRASRMSGVPDGSSNSRSRASSLNSNISNNDQHSGFSVDSFTKIQQSEDKIIPKIEVDDFTEGSEHHGDRESSAIETKKDV
ncbi:16725_t:CDS:2, partial [Acaulospora colombiana]